VEESVGGIAAIVIICFSCYGSSSLFACKWNYSHAHSRHRSGKTGSFTARSPCPWNFRFQEKIPCQPSFARSEAALLFETIVYWWSLLTSLLLFRDLLLRPYLYHCAWSVITVTGHFGPKTLRYQDTSAVGTSAEVSRRVSGHFGTNFVSYRYQSAGNIYTRY